MKVKSQEHKQFCNLNFSDVMWKPGILRSQVTHLIWLPYQCHLEVFQLGGQRQTDQYAAHIFLRLSLITCRACCVVYKFAITHCHKIKTHSNSYQCSLFHLQIHLCTCSYRIPWCFCRQHYPHYSCVLRWYTRRYLKQEKESNWKTFNWNGVITKLFALTQCVSLIC